MMTDKSVKIDKQSELSKKRRKRDGFDENKKSEWNSVMRILLWVGWLVGRYLGSPHLFLSLFHFVALGPSLNTCIFILNDEGINISTVSSSFLSNMHGNEATHNTS